jgi:hypothetical protein
VDGRTAVDLARAGRGLREDRAWGVAAEGEVMAELLDALHGGGWFGGRRGFNAGTTTGRMWRDLGTVAAGPLGTEIEQQETEPTRSHLQR